MNKKQKIVLCVMVGALFCVFLSLSRPRYGGDWGSSPHYNPWGQIIICDITVILISGLLIFILKSKKRNKEANNNKVGK